VVHVNKAHEEALWDAIVTPFRQHVEAGGSPVSFFVGLGWTSIRKDLDAGTPPDLLRDQLGKLLDALVIPDNFTQGENLKKLVKIGAEAALDGIPLENLMEALANG
jgi:hypothetical protein